MHIAGINTQMGAFSIHLRASGGGEDSSASVGARPGNGEGGRRCEGGGRVVAGTRVSWMVVEATPRQWDEHSAVAQSGVLAGLEVR
eukprot:COSAG01_NODE_10068_length_2257_cov_1.042632_2_plen_86_part_00